MGCASSVPANSSATKKVSDADSLQNNSFSKNYDMKQELGRGSFAQVRLCVHKKSNRELAVKILKSTSEKHWSKACLELEVWKSLGTHQNIVVLEDSYVEPGVHYFVMKRCWSTINEKLDCPSGLSWYVNLLDSFQQVFAGLAHCHAMNVAHRDLKTANLLVDANGVVKIADFGLSAFIPETGGISGIVGSIPFMSPEMVKGKTYGCETDIWSCGALIYNLVYGVYVYDSSIPVSELTLDERRKHMTKAIASDMPKPAYQPKVGMQRPSNNLRDLIKTLLSRSVLTRPKADVCEKLLAKMKMNLHNKGDEDEDTSSWAGTGTTESSETRCPSGVSNISYGCSDIQSSLQMSV